MFYFCKCLTYSLSVFGDGIIMFLLLHVLINVYMETCVGSTACFNKCYMLRYMFVSNGLVADDSMNDERTDNVVKY